MPPYFLILEERDRWKDPSGCSWDCGVDRCVCNVASGGRCDKCDKRDRTDDTNRVRWDQVSSLAASPTRISQQHIEAARLQVSHSVFCDSVPQVSVCCDSVPQVSVFCDNVPQVSVFCDSVPQVFGRALDVQRRYADFPARYPLAGGGQNKRSFIPMRRGVATKFRLGGTDSGESKLLTPRFRFLLGLRALYLGNIVKLKMLTNIQKIFFKSHHFGGSPPEFWT